ncbi:CRAL-TRIO domain-containing protein, partial [Nephila pilipes]
KWNMKHLTFEKFMQLVMMHILQLLRDQMSQINGLRIIFDFKGTGLPLIQMCSPQNLYICNHMILNCMPIRIKGLHTIHGSFVLRLVWPIAKRILSHKIRDRKTLLHQCQVSHCYTLGSQSL